jgi:hypothetical protein
MKISKEAQELLEEATISIDEGGIAVSVPCCFKQLQ